MKKRPSLIHNPPFPKNYASEFLMLKRGQGAWLEDAGGKRYLDFGSGIAVNNFGYGDKELAKIAYKQMLKVTHVSNLFTTSATVKLAKELVATGPFQAVHFGNSGTEANEAALKYARAWSLRTKGEGNHHILAFKNSFHGRTMGSLSVTYTQKYRAPFEPLVPGVVFADYNNVQSLHENFSPHLAAVIVEPIQGEGGLSMMSAEFAQELNSLCERHNVLLIVDEIQTGLGRTGSFYAHTAMGLKPDIVSLSKPLAGGLPLSATLINEKVNSQIHVGDHGTTFGGGPVTTAVSLKVLERINQPQFLELVQEKGNLLRQQLEKLTHLELVEGLRGKGLLQGIALRMVEGKEPPMAKIIESARDQGLLILRSGANVIRLAPPLIIKDKDIIRGVSILKKILYSIKGETP
jgi:acetylornithine/N-succinyldiaminopimelate aminotransferase